MNNFIEDFKYEFDFSISYSEYMEKIDYPIFLGYVFLHQFTKQDICEQSNEDLKEIISNSLEKGEIVKETNNHFLIKLNYLNHEIIEYVKLILKYSLILYKDFEVNDNNITFERYYDS